MSLTVIALSMIALAAGSSTSLSALMNTVGGLGGVVFSAVAASVAVQGAGVMVWTWLTNER